MIKGVVLIMSNGIRRHYMTLCIYNNTEVTVQTQNGIVIVTFEQAAASGFKTVEFEINGTLHSNDGFNASEIAIFHKFLLRNAQELLKLNRGDYDA